jgi:NAD(P)-dependent dehydrogenase (short-subunit alcohol dehydrogenase family)
VLASGSGRLRGLSAVITGAASGIGRATAEAFHAEGARILLADVDGEGALALASALGDGAGACAADLGAGNGVRTVLAAAHDVLGPVDVLVNDAGISSKTPFPEVEEAEWDRLLRVNVLAAVELARGVAVSMAERGSGVILNVSSISGLGGGAPQSVYGITKGALLGLTRELARTLRPVRVNAVLPGVIDTPMVRRDIALGGDADGSALAAWIREAVPIARIGTPAEVASVLAFLASPDAAGMTGALVPVEGGFLSA